MKARLITIGESEIRQRVEEEYQKKKDQIYESVIQDVLPQLKCPNCRNIVKVSCRSEMCMADKR